MAATMLLLSTVLLSVAAEDVAPEEVASEEVAPGEVAASDVPAHRLQAPGPLAPRSFQLPEAKTATLSNGLEVLLVENHEVPIVYLNVVVRSGSATDFEGLGYATPDGQHVSWKDVKKSYDREDMVEGDADYMVQLVDGFRKRLREV